MENSSPGAVYPKPLYPAKQVNFALSCWILLGFALKQSSAEKFDHHWVKTNSCAIAGGIHK